MQSKTKTSLISHPSSNYYSVFLLPQKIIYASLSSSSIYSNVNFNPHLCIKATLVKSIVRAVPLYMTFSIIYAANPTTVLSFPTLLPNNPYPPGFFPSQNFFLLSLLH